MVYGDKRSGAGEGIDLVRDVLQIISMLVCVGMLVAVWRRGRRYHEQAREWYVFIFIAVLTLVYYVGVFVDLYLVNIWTGSDVSSVVRLAALIALLLYVLLFPRRIIL